MATAFPPFDGSAPKTQDFNEAPEMGIDPSKRYTATMATSLGELVIALDAIKAPKTVNNFVFLALYHYYDGVMFHRIINGFMCQGGDPTAPVAAAPATASRTNSPSPVSTRSARSPWRTPARTRTAASSSSCPDPSGVGLPPQYSLFGQVVKGLDIVDPMQRVPTDGGDKPKTDVVINSVTITVADD